MSHFCSISAQSHPAFGDLPIRNRTLLAPMSGVSDVPFRRLAWRFGAGMVVSEMVASDAFVTGQDEMRLKAEGAGLPVHMVQLAGCETRWFAEAVRIAEAGGADIIDINMGCPSKRVTNGASGSALMRDLDHAQRLIEAAVSTATVPVTLKMRLGWDEASINAPELAARAESLGVRMVTVHGRTRNQFYKGQANWNAVAAVRAAVSLPLVVNGDIADAATALEALARSGADTVMIGRASYGAPWICGQIARALDGADVPDQPAGDALCDLVLEHYEAILSHYGVELGVRNARKHLGWYLDGLPEGVVSALERRAILTATDPAIVSQLVRQAFNPSELRQAA